MPKKRGFSKGDSDHGPCILLAKGSDIVIHRVLASCRRIILSLYKEINQVGLLLPFQKTAYHVKTTQATSNDILK